MLRLFDDASDPAPAATLIQRQIDDGTNFFLASFGSNIVLPASAVTERAQADGADRTQSSPAGQVRVRHAPAPTCQFAPTVALFKTLKAAPATYSVIYTNDASSKTTVDRVQMCCDKRASSGRMHMAAAEADGRSGVLVLGSVRGKMPDLLLGDSKKFAAYYRSKYARPTAYHTAAAAARMAVLPLLLAPFYVGICGLMIYRLCWRWRAGFLELSPATPASATRPHRRRRVQCWPARGSVSRLGTAACTFARIGRRRPYLRRAVSRHCVSDPASCAARFSPSPCWTYQRGPFGVGLLSIPEDEDTARVLGVPKPRWMRFMATALFAGRGSA